MTEKSDAAEDVTIEAFDDAARQAGLRLDPEERQRLYDGYKGLQSLLARLPAATPMEDEPAVVALVPDAKVTR